MDHSTRSAESSNTAASGSGKSYGGGSPQPGKETVGPSSPGSFSQQQQHAAHFSRGQYPGQQPMQSYQQQQMQLQHQQHQNSLRKLQRDNQIQQQRRKTGGSVGGSPLHPQQQQNSHKQKQQFHLQSNSVPTNPTSSSGNSSGNNHSNSHSIGSSKRTTAGGGTSAGGANVSGPKATAPTSGKSSGGGGGGGNKRHSVTGPPLLLEESATLLQHCDWKDKGLWCARQFLGGQSVNGFQRSTATAQRIKKQRARQQQKTNASSSNNNKSGQTTATAESGVASTADPTKTKKESAEQIAENVLKHEIMNPRFAKKLKTEFEHGIQFCKLLHKTIREVLMEMDSTLPIVPPLSRTVPGSRSSQQQKQHRSGLTSHPTSAQPPTTKSSSLLTGQHPQASFAARNAAAVAASSTSTPSASGTSTTSNKIKPSKTDASGSGQSKISSGNSPPISTAGNASGSTLRRNRKKKVPPNEEVCAYPEFDPDTNKRVCAKKDYAHRLIELTRFRPLRRGDAVAARTSSQDLWILAKVVEDYPGHKTPVSAFFKQTQARRDQNLKQKVVIQDVEDGAESIQVQRNLVLPLPRHVSEAADWCQRVKKGTRVYAMYPQTTSLYTATVVDATTYCRGDDDIIVVEFDDDEPNSQGKTPSCHIPARFVTIIPREFPGSQPPTTTGSGKSNNNKKRSSQQADINNFADEPNDEALNSMLLDNIDLNVDDLPGLDGFDDLDFDLLGDS